MGIMRPPRRRETFIALRATKTAHGVARDVLNPHLDVPEFQREMVSADDVMRPCQFNWDGEKPLASDIIRGLVIAVLIILFTCLVVFVAVSVTPGLR